ncbi:Uncharacterised protein [Flavonifractor plautii]|uniref:Uncharacterized protein n=1 Tax=Flavonifractor plautii TaxID=292800 RepID=A0A174P0B4_FLAPL|nr:Uncharacterised protein [Flavonifractor plautii]
MSTGSRAGGRASASAPRPSPAAVRLRPVTATTLPAWASSTVWNLDPE